MKKALIDMENNTYSKANKVCDETKDKSTEYTKCLGFKIKEKEKNTTNHVLDS